MLDYIIKGASIADGSGAVAVTGSVGVKDGRIVEVGDIDDGAREEFDADGLVVAPGIVDPHTHYDAQLAWDPYATPSVNHGVTSVMGGNCGFTLAPLRAVDDDYTRRMLARVEGMPLEALQAGLDVTWEGFGGYLDGFEGRIAVNAGFMVGHCALRRYVMGEASVGEEASPDQVAEMKRVLRESLAAGALGLSTTRSHTHSDGAGDPVPSRFASEEELLELCDVVGEVEGTGLEAIVAGCLSRFSEAELTLLAAMSSRAARPLNWNVLGIDPRDPARIPHQLLASDRAREAGGRVVALTMPIQVPLNMSLRTVCAIHLIPGFGEVFNRPVPERIQLLRDPAVRARLAELAARPEAGLLGRSADFRRYIIGDTYSAENEGLTGRRVVDIAAERGVDAFTAVVDIAVNDELRTVLWPIPDADDDASWRLRRDLWEDPRTLIGGSDAGAHLDRMCGSPYPTRFLADSIRGRQLITMERTVQLMTDAPARLFGLRDRGRIAPGYHADLFVFDPSTVDSQPPALVPDLPGPSSRLTAGSIGVARVLVNGVVTVEDGRPTGVTAGTVLRSGRDTYTPDLTD